MFLKAYALIIFEIDTKLGLQIKMNYENPRSIPNLIHLIQILYFWLLIARKLLTTGVLTNAPIIISFSDFQLSNLGSDKIHTQPGVFVNTQLRIYISQQNREEWGTSEYTHTSYIVILGPSQKPLLVFCIMIYRRQILALNLKEWWLQNRGIHFSTANLLCIGCWVALKKSP